jgi:surface protein
MFRSCRKLKKVDLSSFNTARVQTFRSMFNMCESLEELNLDHFNTDSGALMSYMFYKMASIRKISIRGMNINRSTATVTYMFQGDPNLTELHVSDGFRRPAELSMPSNIFAVSSDAAGFRTASIPGELTIRTTEASAAWLARTNLRFLQSGYQGKTPIKVTFLDDATGAVLSPTWAPN